MNIAKPERATHTYTQHLHASPELVFPLLCPVRECDWVNGWVPGLVITASGIAERDCVFTTGSGPDEAVWVVSAYDPPQHIEFFKFTAGHSVCRITIDLRVDGSAGTAAEITYAYTAIAERGAAYVREFTADFYVRFMRAWESELNHYLATGSKLPVRASDA